MTSRANDRGGRGEAGPVEFDWAGLAALLSDPPSFRALWEHDRHEVERGWAALEDNSDFRREIAYVDAIAQAALGIGGPDGEVGDHESVDLAFGHGLVALFAEDRFGAAEVLARHWLMRCRTESDVVELCDALGALAGLSRNNDDSWALLVEQRKLCLDSDDERLERLRARGLSEMAMRTFCQVLMGEPATRCGHDAGLDDSAAVVETDDITSADRDHVIRRLLAEMRALCKANDDDEGLRRWMITKAELLWLNDDQRKPARCLAERAVRLCREAGDLDGLLDAIAIVCGLRDDDVAAEETLGLLDEAEGIARDLGRRRRLSFVLCSKGRLLASCGELEAAVTVLLERAEIRNGLGLSPDIVEPLCALRWGDPAVDRERNQARAVIMERLARALDDDEALVAALRGQVDILVASGEVGQALPLLEEQTDVCRRGRLEVELARNLATRAELLTAGDPETALGLLGERLEILLAWLEHGGEDVDSHSVSRKAEDTMTARAALLKSVGRHGAALQAYRELEVFTEGRRGHSRAAALIGQHGVLSAQLNTCRDRARAKEFIAELDAVYSRLNSPRAAAVARDRLARRRRAWRRRGVTGALSLDQLSLEC